ncbi:hypothetical protein [Zhihengliuella halotolerans]|uniref:Glycerophosphoryl diester phosphodiesterase family protein n=1 Tax=Zhihengliuella halotolerans TaxID=370736 RepID=A0A4Q8ABV0_9MICC|nr:hypothetical protein [Zhihengliuella halotolerans]RZU61075.1 hypothetical protein EV380_0632 [Zhihengliuella halotolerans]
MTHQPQPYAPFPVAPRPGALPLRILGLGDYFEAIFRIIRFGPMATLPILIVSQAAASLLILLGLGVVFSDSMYFLSGTVGSDVPPMPTAGALAGGLTVTLAGMLIGLIGQLLTVPFSTVTAIRAASNRRTSLADAWSAFRPRAGKFLFLYFLILVPIGIVATLIATALVAVWFYALFNAFEHGTTGGALWIVPLVGIGMIVLGTWLAVKLSVALNALSVEDISATGAIRRTWTLTRGLWWRTFGILLFFGVLTSVASGMLSFPVELVTGFSSAMMDLSGAGELSALVIIGMLVSAALSGAAAALQVIVVAVLYIDLRFRKEGLHQAIWAQTQTKPAEPPHSDGTV